MSRGELHLEMEGDNTGALSSGSSTTPSLPTSSLPPLTNIPDIPSSTSQTLASYEEESKSPPQCGLEYFNLRRQRWLTPTESVDDDFKPYSQSDAKDSAARVRLERLVSKSEITDETWAAGISSVWSGLVNGGRLRKPLPLDIVVKILKAGWHRDGTWPKGLVVPASPPAPLPNELGPDIEEDITLPEPALLSARIPASATVQERLSRIEGADNTGYLSDASRVRLENALEKYDGNIDSLVDEDILRIKHDSMVVLETKMR